MYKIDINKNRYGFLWKKIEEVDSVGIWIFYNYIFFKKVILKNNFRLILFFFMNKIYFDILNIWYNVVFVDDEWNYIF